MSNWSHETTDDPVYADRRNFYKVERWTLWAILAFVTGTRRN